MALQLVRLNPLNGIELLSPGRWRMIHTNAIAYGFIANAFLGMLHWVVPRLTLHPACSPKSRLVVLVIFWAWQIVVRRRTAVGHPAGPGPGARMGRDAGLDRPARPGRPAAGGDQLHGADRARSTGPAVRDALVLHGGVRVDVADVRDGQLPAAVLRRRHERRRDRRAVHPRPGRPVRDAAGLGPDVLLRADPAEEADLEPRPVAGRLLGAGVLLSAPGNSPLPLHADPDVPAVRGGDLDDRGGAGGHDGHHQLPRHALRVDRRR